MFVTFEGKKGREERKETDRMVILPRLFLFSFFDSSSSLKEELIGALFFFFSITFSAHGFSRSLSPFLPCASGTLYLRSLFLFSSISTNIFFEVDQTASERSVNASNVQSVCTDKMHSSSVCVCVVWCCLFLVRLILCACLPSFPPFCLCCLW